MSPNKDVANNVAVNPDISYNELRSLNDDADEPIEHENEEITFQLDETIQLDVENTNEEHDVSENAGNSAESCENMEGKNVTDNVTEISQPGSMPAWVTVAEQITVEDFVSSQSVDNEVDNDIEIIDICQKKSKEFEMCSENVLHKEKSRSVTDLLKDDIPEAILVAKYLYLH